MGVKNQAVYNWFHVEDIRIVTPHASVEDTCVFLHGGIGKQVHVDMPADKFAEAVNQALIAVETQSSVH